MEDPNYPMPPGTVFLAEVASKRSSPILHPVPSSDPNDPLNWSKKRKVVNLTLVLFYVLFTFVVQDIQFVAYTQYVEEIGMTTFVYTTTIALSYTGLAVGCIFFIPLIHRYGRRPIYILSLAIQLACSIWSARVKTNNGLMASDLVMGLGSAVAETIVQVTIADLFFVHQYATMNGLFLLFQSIGAYLGPVAAGFVTDSQGWRWMWWWCAIFLSVNLVLVLFFFEETAYVPRIDGRLGSGATAAAAAMAVTYAASGASEDGKDAVDDRDAKEAKTATNDPDPDPDHEAAHEAAHPSRPIAIDSSIPIKPWRERLALVTKTNAPISHHFYTPLVLLASFPAIAYTAITYGALLTWFAVSGTVSTEILVYPPYNFSSTALGLFGIPPMVGVLIGTAIVSPLSDWLIVRLARRNGGIFEPEMRLYPAIPGAILNAGGLALSGIGISKSMAWPVLAVGSAVSSAGFVLCGDVALSYLIDCYQSVVGDGFVAVVFIRNAFAVIVLFSLDDWVTGMGIQNMYVLCVVLSAVIGVVPVVMLLAWGKKARVWTAKRYKAYALRQPAHRDV